MKDSYIENKRERQSSFIGWFTPQMTTMATPQSCGSQDLHLGLSCGCRALSIWGAFSATLPHALAGIPYHNMTLHVVAWLATQQLWSFASWSSLIYWQIRSHHSVCIIFDCSRTFNTTDCFFLKALGICDTAISTFPFLAGHNFSVLFCFSLAECGVTHGGRY